MRRHDRQRPSAEQSGWSLNQCNSPGMGSSWTQVSDFQWTGLTHDTTIQWSPARSNVRYTPQADEQCPAGVMHTNISSGRGQGWIEMGMTAERAVRYSGNPVRRSRFIRRGPRGKCERVGNFRFAVFASGRALVVLTIAAARRHSKLNDTTASRRYYLCCPQRHSSA